MDNEYENSPQSTIFFFRVLRRDDVNKIFSLFLNNLNKISINGPNWKYKKEDLSSFKWLKNYL